MYTAAQLQTEIDETIQFWIKRMDELEGNAPDNHNPVQNPDCLSRVVIRAVQLAEIKGRAQGLKIAIRALELFGFEVSDLMIQKGYRLIRISIDNLRRGVSV